MNEPKRHHWWPEAHQQFWTDSDGKIACLDKSGKLYRSPPRDVAVIGHHNSLVMPDGKKNTAPEKLLGKNVDDKVRSVIKKIADLDRRTIVPALERMTLAELNQHNARCVPFGFEPLVNFEYVMLGREDRIDLAKYVASMIVRVPTFRARISNVFRMIAGVLERRGTKIRDIDREDHNHQISWMLENIPIFARSLAMWPWVLIKSAPGECFIFSDSPVSLNTPQGLNGGLADFLIPLLPNLVLCGLDGPQKGVREGVHVMQASAVGTQTYNRITVGNAQERVFLKGSPSETMKVRLLENFGRPKDRDVLLKASGGQIEVSKYIS